MKIVVEVKIIELFLTVVGNLNGCLSFVLLRNAILNIIFTI